MENVLIPKIGRIEQELQEYYVLQILLYHFTVLKIWKQMIKNKSAELLEKFKILIKCRPDLAMIITWFQGLALSQCFTL